MIKAVFFDVGGVTVKEVGPNAVWNATEKAVAKLLRLPLMAVKEYFCSKWIHFLDEGKISESQFWKKLCQRRRIQCPSRKKLKQLFRLREVKIKPAIREIAGKLKKQGIIAGIISNAILPHAEIIQKTGVYQFFNPVILSCRVKAGKPKKRIFRIAAKRAGVKFSEILYFDDRQRNIEAARKLGIYGYLYRGPKHIQKTLIRHGIKI